MAAAIPSSVTAVPECCDPSVYRRFFNSKEARRRLRRYRAKGLDSTATSMVAYLETRGLRGVDVLEVGGGVGDLQVELLKAGAERSVNVELSGGYEEAARELLEAEGLSDRVARRVGDFVLDHESVEPADVVVLNRVVCCYPLMEEMMGAAVAKTRRFLALSFPRERWWMKLAIGAGNSWMALRRCDFRGFVHPVAGIESVARADGLEAVHRHHTLGWQAVVFERPAPAA